MTILTIAGLIGWLLLVGFALILARAGKGN